MSFSGLKGPNQMMKFARYSEHPTPTAVNQAILRNSKRCEGEGHIVLPDVLSEFLRLAIIALKNGLKEWRWIW